MLSETVSLSGLSKRLSVCSIILLNILNLTGLAYLRKYFWMFLLSCLIPLLSLE